MVDNLEVAVNYAIENSPIDRINNSLKKVTKVAGATGLALAGMAVKTGLSEAMDLEGFRLTLETVTKDVTKAKELMQWGSEFANATPFENKEIVEGITKLTSYGMTAKDVLPKVGDMASVMGKSLDQAVEAIADALRKVWASLNWVISVKAKSILIFAYLCDIIASRGGLHDM